MTTRQLDPTDILCDVESYLADTPAALGFEHQVQLCALVMEVAAHVHMLKASASVRGNAGTACHYLERAANDLLALVADNDQVAEAAADLLDALPEGGRKQALAAYLGGD